MFYLRLKKIKIMNTEKNKLEAQKENLAEKKVNKISSNLPVMRSVCECCGGEILYSKPQRICKYCIFKVVMSKHLS